MCQALDLRTRNEGSRSATVFVTNQTPAAAVTRATAENSHTPAQQQQQEHCEQDCLQKASQINYLKHCQWRNLEFF